MILRPVGHGGVVNPLNFGEERRKLPPWLIGAIGASIALHVAGAVWIYNQRFVLPAEEPPPTGIDITLWAPPPKPKPPEITQEAPKPTSTVPVRRPETVPTTTETAPFEANPEAERGEAGGSISTQNEPVVETGTAEVPPPAVIRNPDWVSKPTGAQMERVYPRRALEDGISGRAVLRCAVTVNGSLTNCSVASETPAGAGFGAAALKLTRHFRMSPKMVDGRPIEGALVSIPLNFSTGD